MDSNTVNILVLDVRKRHESSTLDMPTKATDDSTGCNTAADTLLIGTSVDDAEDCCRQEFISSMVLIRVPSLFSRAPQLQQDCSPSSACMCR
jgi:hypothetical protein